MDYFKYLAEIKFKNKIFLILINKKYQKYYLEKLESGEYIYPQLEDFNNLNKLFIFNDSSICDVEKTNSDGKNKKRKVFELVPKVIHKGKLISLVAALSLTGCGRIVGKAEIVDNSISNVESNSDEEIKISDLQILRNNGYNCEQLENNVFLLNSFDNYVFCKNAEEFKKYLDVKNPSFEDLKRVIRDNKNIKDEYKEILYKGLDNIEMKNLNMDLSTLYYNLERIKVVSMSSSEIKANANKEGAAAYFDSNTGVVAINEETITPKILCHEMLGHGLTEAKICDNGNNIVRSFSFQTIKLQNDGRIKLVSIDKVGSCGVEGIADKIACIALNEDCRAASYSAELFEVEVFKDMLDIELGDLIDNGSYKIVEKMQENGIESSLEYIVNLDFLCSAHQNLEVKVEDSYTVSANMKNFMIEYAENAINNDKDKNVVIEKISDAFDNSGFENINVGNIHVIDNINVSTLKNNIIDEINKTKEKDEEEK